MIFQCFKPFYAPKAGRWCPGVWASELDYSAFLDLVREEMVKNLVTRYRNGETECKAMLPAVTWCGTSATRYRKAADMTPTGFFMVDIDKMDKEPFDAWENIFAKLTSEKLDGTVLLAHRTPSGRGLRIVMKCHGDRTLQEQMEWLEDLCKLSEWGKFDTAVKDVSRLSFLVPFEDFFFINGKLFNEAQPPAPSVEDKAAADRAEEKTAEQTEAVFAPDETVLYRGHKVADIVARYMEVYGEPEAGERHTFYNQLVKYFRCICDNNPDTLLAVLPRFGHTGEECRSQCRSICRTNTTGRLPREFFIFLVKNGFYKKREEADDTADTDAEHEEKPSPLEGMPPLPPVFREIVSTCPREFAVPCINALMPIMGTLTSYVRAVYPYDAREHSTQFFSIIYAPPGTGKGFIERFMSLLHRNLEMRDILSDARESLYCKMQVSKGDNERAPENPHVTKRIMEAKNSETDFLEKQAANSGHHMFTYAAEMDQWRKGVRAAGGNKDDMIRIAWDNGYYGQSFKSPNSFKGRVRLYWNVLITGTQDQLDAYFKNVGNGLVTRCCFTSIDNQEFADAPKWGTLSRKNLDIINRFVDRCDRNEYAETVEFDMDTLRDVPDADFDKEVPWRFQFNPIKRVELAWIMPTIDKWLSEQKKTALLSQDLARDVFRRRVAVRGFRLALICSQLWENMNSRNEETTRKFVYWWMNVDIEQILRLYGDKYNELAGAQPDAVKTQPGIWSMLGDTFTFGDVVEARAKCGVQSLTKQIIYRWKRSGMIENTNEKNTYKKLKK